jgi:hypothetical protein
MNIVCLRLPLVTVACRQPYRLIPDAKKKGHPGEKVFLKNPYRIRFSAYTAIPTQ